MIDKKFKGFTLIELLIVVAIVAILAGVVLIAVNPARQMGQARNSERAAEANAILSAINQYQIDNNGALPACIATTDAKCIGTGPCVGETNFCDLSVLAPTYIAEIPKDATGTDADRGYNVIKTATDRITVSAPDAELGQTISFTR